MSGSVDGDAKPDVKASIRPDQADKIEVLRQLGIIGVPRNTFVKAAVDEKLERTAAYGVRMDALHQLLGGQEGLLGEALGRPWARTLLKDDPDD